MKEWYQYRCEEVTDGSDFSAYNLINSMFFSERSLSKRLQRFLFFKLYFGGIHWIYQGGFSDFRGIYDAQGT